ncbi:MAG: O-succinylbenzoic acid--CoA ligase [Polyangiales bacterium]|jgi:O-succinylbenzoic acid--CoA ligase
MNGERFGTLDFMHWCEVQPDALALTHRGMGVTYGGLQDRIHAKLERLAIAGFGPTRRLAVIPGTTIEDAILLLAAVELRVPLVLVHPALPELDQKQRARSAGARFLEEGASDERPIQDTFGVLFTSGTSGQAKRVRLSRGAVAAALDASADRLGWQDEDRWGLFLPPAHIGGLSILLRCLRAGRTVVLSDDSKELPTVCAMERVTLLSLVPTQLHRLLEAGVRLPSSIRAVLVGGARLPAKLRQRAEDNAYPIFPTYGMTETSAQAATARPGESGNGKLLKGLEGQVREGVLWLRGPSLFDGYEGDEGLDRSSFDADGFFCTGDRASLDTKGHLDVFGRSSDTIITGGENVDPSEVERALLETQGFEAVCVVGVPSQEWGEVVGLVAVLKQGANISELLNAAVLPAYAKPRLLRVVDALPMTALAKVERSACRNLMLEESTPS